MMGKKEEENKMGKLIKVKTNNFKLPSNLEEFSDSYKNYLSVKHPLRRTI